MNTSRNTAAWALACRLIGCEVPTLESALSDTEKTGLAVLSDLRAVKQQKIDLQFVLCPYCQLLRGAVVQGEKGFACQCPDCGMVSVDPADLRAWLVDADWLIRKLRGALTVPAQQASVSVTNSIWRIGSYQRRPVILARSLDTVLAQPNELTRASTRGASPPWLITPKPHRDVDGDPFNGSAVWLPLEERFSLYGGNIQFIEPGILNTDAANDPTQAIYGPFSADFRSAHLPDWPHGAIALSEAQASVFKALWHFKGQAQQAEVIMIKAERGSAKPIDVFKVKSQNKGDPKYEGPLHAYKLLVTTDRRAGTYAMLCAV